MKRNKTLNNEDKNNNNKIEKGSIFNINKKDNYNRINSESNENDMTDEILYNNTI